MQQFVINKNATRVRPKSFYVKRIKKIILYTFAVAVSAVMIYPLVFMAMAGFFTAKEYYSTALTLFPIPKDPTWKNYLALFDAVEYPMMGTYFLNSFVRTVYISVMTLVTTLICGYVFARLKFKGKDTLFLALLLTSMLPGTITLVPTYLMYANFPLAGGQSILDTWAVYLIGGPAINVMATFVTRQYIENVPVALDESARMDGANVFVIMFGIILPVAKPILIYVLVTTAITVWNDWSTSFFFTSSETLRLLPSAITVLSMEANTGLSIPDYPMMITLGLLTTIPALLLYIFFQRYFVESIAYVGIKD